MEICTSLCHKYKNYEALIHYQYVYFIKTIAFTRNRGILGKVAFITWMFKHYGSESEQVVIISPHSQQSDLFLCGFF